MDRLVSIGFIKVGYWTIRNSQIRYVISSHSDSKRILYCFISNNEIKYIGKTTKTLIYRMKGYQNPGSSQRTNIRVNNNIKSHLEQGLPLYIYVLPDNGLFKYGDFKLSIAGGLEDTLIDEFKPEWNITGKTANPRSIHPDVDERHSRRKLYYSDHSNTFEVILWTAYYNQGFFNVRQAYSVRFGEDKEIIRIQLSNSPNNYINGVINRTANNNHTPRILGRKLLKEWIQNNFKQEDVMVVEIFSPTFIRLGKRQ